MTGGACLELPRHGGGRRKVMGEGRVGRVGG